ncbi:glycoside hydrolase family 25 protein [uncultured Tenacibaculum sp.]|uniref:glycoside hydrolase family 25 protein n=1 Tax=uncultured Tenacibaculum sp. TaxID=174713 RepID=UPI00263458CD|nr:GH25 family lysozyme [uncultured Tenacibaculum sp.]
MKSFNDFEVQLLHEISSFRRDGIVNLKELLEKIFFSKEKGKTLIVQLREQYAIYFLTNKIYNNPINQKKAIVEFSQLLALLEYLNSNGIISIFRKQHFVKNPIFVLNNDFNDIKIESKKIILNDNGDYTDKPEEIKNVKDEIIYKGIQFNDSHFVIKNVMGNVVISDKILNIINDINPEKEKKPFYKKRIFEVICTLLVVFIAFLWLHTDVNKSNKEIQNSIQKIHRKINQTPVLNTNKKTKTHRVKRKFGIDISKWNGNILENKLPDSIHFVISKATEGLTYIDPKFHINWIESKNKKFKRGAYHYYVIEDNPKKQAIHFWKQIQDVNREDFPPIVDIETSNINANLKNIESELLIFLNTIENLSGRTPMIYCSYFFANRHLTDKTFAKYPLWVADYISIKSPIIPKVWKETGWTIWQKSPTYKINTKATDLDIYLEK